MRDQMGNRTGKHMETQGAVFADFNCKPAVVPERERESSEVTGDHPLCVGKTS